MKIINNKIYIAKGETPTYDVSVIDKQTEAPYMLPSGINNPVIEFIVRPSVYNRADDYVFRAYLDYSTHKKFETPELVEYTDNQWDDSNAPSSGDEEKLHFRITSDGIKEYRYYENGAWVPYEFRISFMFPYEATSLMESKQYKYEVVLFGADVLPGNAGLTNISYKEPLLEATDFIVGGSLSE